MVTDLEELGYNIRIQIMNNGEAIGGVSVELRSNPKYGVTDENGEVYFQGVEPGQHTLKLAYDGYTTEQKLVIGGEDTEVGITVNVTFQQTDGLLSTTHWVLLLLLVLVVGAFIGYWSRRK